MSAKLLSVVILNHRADFRLIKCLKSIAWASEIIVLDHDSNFDWTAYPQVKVTKITGPVTDFAAERNQGLSLASHDWVLFLDSDEFLAKTAEPQITQAISKSGINGYYLQRRDGFAGQTLKWGEVKNVWVLRLVKKTQAKFVRPVHEITQVIGKTEHLSTIIFHEPHLSVSEFLSKVNNYAQLEAELRPTYSGQQFWREVIFYPAGKFIGNYIFQLGILDGFAGLVYAVMMSLHSLLVRIYAYEKSVT